MHPKLKGRFVPAKSNGPPFSLKKRPLQPAADTVASPDFAEVSATEGSFSQASPLVAPPSVVIHPLSHASSVASVSSLASGNHNLAAAAAEIPRQIQAATTTKVQKRVLSDTGKESSLCASPPKAQPQSASTESEIIERSPPQEAKPTNFPGQEGVRSVAEPESEGCNSTNLGCDVAAAYVEAGQTAADSAEAPRTETQKDSKRKARKKAGGTSVGHCHSEYASLPLGERELIKLGMRVAVYWNGDDLYYEGTVENERPHKKKRFFVRYDDDETEWVNFKKVPFFILNSVKSTETPLYCHRDWVNDDDWVAGALSHADRITVTGHVNEERVDNSLPDEAHAPLQHSQQAHDEDMLTAHGADGEVDVSARSLQVTKGKGKDKTQQHGDSENFADGHESSSTFGVGLPEENGDIRNGSRRDDSSCPKAKLEIDKPRGLHSQKQPQQGKRADSTRSERTLDDSDAEESQSDGHEDAEQRGVLGSDEDEEFEFDHKEEQRCPPSASSGRSQPDATNSDSEEEFEFDDSQEQPDACPHSNSSKVTEISAVVADDESDTEEFEFEDSEQIFDAPSSKRPEQGKATELASSFEVDPQSADLIASLIESGDVYIPISEKVKLGRKRSRSLDVLKACPPPPSSKKPKRPARVSVETQSVATKASATNESARRRRDRRVPELQSKTNDDNASTTKIASKQKPRRGWDSLGDRPKKRKESRCLPSHQVFVKSKKMTRDVGREARSSGTNPTRSKERLVGMSRASRFDSILLQLGKKRKEAVPVSGGKSTANVSARGKQIKRRCDTDLSRASAGRKHTEELTSAETICISGGEHKADAPRTKAGSGLPAHAEGDEADVDEGSLESGPPESTGDEHGADQRRKEEARTLTPAEIRRILGDDHSHGVGADNWVRRSARMPSRAALMSPNTQVLLHHLRTNDPAVVVLKMKKYVSDPSTPPVVIDAVLDALEENTNCESLYIQNYNEGMRDQQVLRLLQVLQKPSCKIWCLNIGETYKVKRKTWKKFARGLKHTSVTHMYASEHTISPELKEYIRYTIRENRKKHDMHIDPKNLDTIVKCTHCWWNPINAKVLRPFLHAHGYAHILHDKEAQGARGTQSAERVLV